MGVRSQSPEPAVEPYLGLTVAADLLNRGQCMQRRQFAVGAGLALAGFSLPLWAGGAQYEPYSRAAYEARLASGEPFLLGFSTNW